MTAVNFSELKSDGSFIGAVAKTPRNAAIVKSTITLCYALGLSVVGEGVETAEDLACSPPTIAMPPKSRPSFVR